MPTGSRRGTAGSSLACSPDARGHLPGAGRGARRRAPDPELQAPDDAIVRIEATGVCGSDLHIFHGRVAIEPGFTIGHEYVGTVVAAGDAVSSVAVGDRVLGCFQVACAICRACRAGNFHKCERSRTFGHGAALGGLQGTQAEQALVPHANLTLRRVPDGMASDVALFAGDVMGTGFHAATPVRPGDSVAVLGLGPVGLCAVQAARAAGAAQRHRHRRRRGAARRGERLRRGPRAPHRGRPARGGQGGDRRARGRRGHRRGRRPAGARPRHPRGRQLRHGERRRGLRRARRGPHGPGMDQGADAAHRPGQRDRPPRSGAGAHERRRARPRGRSSPTT